MEISLEKNWQDDFFTQQNMCHNIGNISAYIFVAMAEEETIKLLLYGQRILKNSILRQTAILQYLFQTLPQLQQRIMTNFLKNLN